MSPGLDLGADREKAFRKIDTELVNVAPVSGYALIDGTQINHLGKVSLARARRAAMSAGGDITIARAVGFADVDQLVWEKLEHIDQDPGGRFLQSNGELMIKLTPQAQIEQLADEYSEALRAKYLKWSKKELKTYLQMLEVNWEEVKDVERVFEKAGAATLLKPAEQKELSAAWAVTAGRYTYEAIAQAKEFAKTSYLPRISAAVNKADRVALKHLAARPGFFLRDHLGRVNTQLSRQGKAIVIRGMRQGLGYRAIGKNLREQIPGLWARYGTNYSNVVANAGVQSARAYASVSSFVEAGISYYTWVSVLDQRTTDYCRMMDGMTFTTNGAVEILNRSFQIDNPEEIKQVQPWLRERRDPETGRMQIQTPQGDVLADVIRSGKGNLDDRGEFLLRKGPDEIQELGVGLPPAHGF